MPSTINPPAKEKIIAKKNSAKKAARARSSHMLPLLIIAAVFVFSFSYCFDSKLSLYGDNAKYYILGKALATGQGYADISQPGSPSATYFPPGYPAILSILYKISPDNFTLAKCLNGLFLLGTVLVLYFLFKKMKIEKKLSIGICLLVTLNYPMLLHSTAMMSESSFIFFSVLALYWATELVDKSSRHYGHWALFILSLVASYHIRSIGITVAFACLVYFLSERRYKQALVTLGAYALCIVPWIIHTQKVGNHNLSSVFFKLDPYELEAGSAGFGDMVFRFLVNIKRYLMVEIPNSVLPVLDFPYQDQNSLQWLVGLGIISIAGYGFYRSVYYKWLIGIFVAGVFGIVLLWPPQWFGVRLMLPALPLVLLYFVAGLRKLIVSASEKWPTKWSQQISFATFGLLIILALPTLQRLHDEAKAPYKYDFEQYFALGTWAKSNLPDDSLIACRKPNLLYLFADRKCIYYAQTDNLDLLYSKMVERGTDYVASAYLGGRSNNDRLLPALNKYHQNFEVVYQLKNMNEAYLLKYIGEPSIGQKED